MSNKQVSGCILLAVILVTPWLLSSGAKELWNIGLALIGAWNVGGWCARLILNKE